MDDGRRIVESPTRVRQASKYGIVRYVLAIAGVGCHCICGCLYDLRLNGGIA